MVKFVAGRGAGFGERGVGVVAAREEHAWFEGLLLLLLLILDIVCWVRECGRVGEMRWVAMWSGLDINKMPHRALPRIPQRTRHKTTNAIIQRWISQETLQLSP